MQASPDPIAILVVEDEIVIRLMLTEELEDAGFAVHGAGNANEALNCIAAHPEISVLFTDVNMPGTINGIELARRILTERPAMQLYLASGRERPNDGSIPVESIFIEKPYNVCKVVDAIRNAAGKSAVVACAQSTITFSTNSKDR